MKYSILIMAFFAMAFISGCAPRVIHQNEKSITIESLPEDKDKAFKMADDYCRSLGKTAVPTTIDTNPQVLRGCTEGFECK